MAITGAKLTKISTDSGVVGDWLTNDPTLIFSGTATLSGASTLGVLLDGTLIGTVSLGAGAKAWTFDWSKVSLADGPHTIELTNGQGGLLLPGSLQTFTIDTAAPAAPDTLVLAANSDSGASSTDGITNVRKSTITGNAEAGSTVRLYDTGGTTLLGTATADAVTGTWSITSSSNLSAGAHALTAKATDAAGNVSGASSSLQITIDTAAPSAPSRPALDVLSDSGKLGDFVTKDTTPTIVGTAEAGSTVTIYDGGNFLASGQADAGGNYAIVIAAPLTEGTHNLTSKATDIAGNTSGALAARAVTIDLTPPGAPSAPDMKAGSDSGVSNTDNITNKIAPAFTGTA